MTTTSTPGAASGSRVRPGACCLSTKGCSEAVKNQPPVSRRADPGDALGSHGATHEETLVWKSGDPFYRGVFRTKELEGRGQWGMTYYYEDGSITSTIFNSREEAARGWCARCLRSRSGAQLPSCSTRQP